VNVLRAGLLKLFLWNDHMRREALICLVLIAVTLVVYGQVKDHEFINYDDNVYVTDNQYVQKGLTGASLYWAFINIEAGNWHPLSWLSHMLDFELYGLNPRGHHLTNVLFHLANSILLFVALRWMTAAVWRSGLVAALFALHPLHVESVAWVAERKDLLSTFFWMLTILAYINYVKRSEVKKYLLVLVLFSLSLMAKPMVVTLPFVLLLLDYWPLNRLRFQPQLAKDRSSKTSTSSEHSQLLKLISEKAPLFVLSGIASIIAFLAQQRAGALSEIETVPLTWRIANGLVSYTSYLGKMVWPKGLAVFYPHPMNTLSSWDIALASLLLVVVSVGVIKFAERYQYGLVGWFWYLGTLVPVIGLIQVGEQGMAERYTYVPLIGIFIILAWGVTDLCKGNRYKRTSASVVAIIIVAALTVCTWQQVRYWKNSVELFRHTLKVTAGNYVAHYTLGNALAMQGSLLEAMHHYREALRIKPNYAVAHHNLGNALTMKGDLGQAISHYKVALKIRPQYADAHRNLGVALDRQGKHEEAMHHYREALRINPDDAQSHNNLGVALAEQGKLGEATDHFLEALEIDPSNIEAKRNLEHGLELMGRAASATGK